MLATFVTLAISATMLPSLAAATLRAGDVGFSVSTSAGQTWVYGDSWNNGVFIRNAITLNDAYVGTLRGVPSGHWVWPGAPFQLANGKLGMYAAEVQNVLGKTGMWSFQVIGGVRAEFDPGHAGLAKVTPMPRPGIIYAAAAQKDPASGSQLVYGVDANHHAHVAKVNSDGSITSIRTMGGTISGQFTVLQDPDGKWWMVGQLPFLSRRVVAYPLTGPAGTVTGSGLKLITLPSPGATRYTYAATIHPELNGLLTWAVNGNGAGTPYGLQRQAAFWPLSLTYAKAAASAASAASAKAKTASASSATAHAALSSGGGGIGDRVRLWATSKQQQLETQLATETEIDTTKNWLAPLPDPLSPTLTADPGAPAAWDLGDKPAITPPVDEDTDTQSEFLVPSTDAGYAAQQAAAKAAREARRAAVAAAVAQRKAAAAAQALLLKQAAAQKRLARALSAAEKRAATKAASDAAREAAKANADAAKAARKAKQQADQADAADRTARGDGGSTWELLARSSAFVKLIHRL